MLKKLAKSLAVFGAVATIATAEVNREVNVPSIEVTTNLLQLPHRLNLGGLFATPYFTVESDLDVSLYSLKNDSEKLAAIDADLSPFAWVPRFIIGVRHYFNEDTCGWYAKAGFFYGMTTEKKVPANTATKLEDYETRHTVYAFGGFGHRIRIGNILHISNSAELSKILFKTAGTTAKDDAGKLSDTVNTEVATTWTALKSAVQFRLLNLEFRVS